jgi:hypothetical protein
MKLNSMLWSVLVIVLAFLIVCMPAVATVTPHTYNANVSPGQTVVDNLTVCVKTSAVHNLTLKIDPAFAGWLVNLSPAKYPTVAANGCVPFSVTLKVPAGTTNGTYSFMLKARDGSNAGFGNQKVTIVVPLYQGNLTGWVSSGSDYGYLPVPGARVLVAISIADLSSPGSRWETTTDSQGIYTLGGLPTGIVLFADVLSPASAPTMYYQRPIHYQVNSGPLITCRNMNSAPKVPALTTGVPTQVNFILKQNPNYY